MRSQDRIYASSEQNSALTPSSDFIPEPQKQHDSSLIVRNVEQWLIRRLLLLVKDYPLSLVLWDGQRLSLHPAPELALVIHDRAALYTLIRNPDYEFGELFSQGRITVEGDLVRFLEHIYRANEASASPVQIALKELLIRTRRNNLTKAKENIHHHYDIGNDFYRLWLDQDYMQYTCAYFPDPQMTLEQAQISKMEHICRKLRLKPGDTVIEAGCGWGGFARYMIKHHGVTVRAYNISHEQITYARERAREEGLSDRIQYIEDDFRNITGECDVFVSVGMLEHVGLENYRALGDVIDRCLRPNGRGLIHSIGRNRHLPLSEWISKRIFPGAYPPTLWEMKDIFEPHAFSIQDVENLRLHYAKTLEHWLSRYEAHVDQVRTMFDENFVRAWRLYLAGSVATFRAGGLQLFQVLFTRRLNNDLPWSRAHLYEDKQPGA